MEKTVEKIKEFFVGCSTVALEPETEAEFKDYKPDGYEKDKKGGSVQMYSDGTNRLNVYDYTLEVYEFNLKKLTEKLEKLNGRGSWFKYYSDAVATLEKDIDAREKDYTAKEIDLISKRRRVDILRENYSYRLEHGLFHRGDLQERALWEKIKRLTDELSRLPAKESIYSTPSFDYVADPKNPKVVATSFLDIRVVKREYERRIKSIEKSEIGPVEDKISCTKNLLKEAVNAKKKYYKWLNAPAPKAKP